MEGEGKEMFDSMMAFILDLIDLIKAILRVFG